MIYGIIILVLIIISILIAYYFDYKSNPEEFTLSIKTLGNGLYKGLFYCMIFVGLNALYESIIPLNKKHGIELNSEREKIGIPVLEKNWETIDSEQFSITYWSPDITKNGHFKKVIEYGILNPKTETDYYHNEKKEGTFAWSKYEFANNTFEYFLEKPNEKTVSITEKGNLKLEKQTVILKINKAEFEKYITD